VDRLVGVVEPDVDVDPEDDLLPRDELEAGHELAVARPRDDPLLLPQREGMGARGAHGQVELGGHGLDRPPQPTQLGPGLRDAVAGAGGDLADRFHELRLDVAGDPGLGQRLEQRLDRVGEVERLRVDDHQLLLDADREGSPREGVLHKRQDMLAP
jgi:hypothetical protein